MGKTMRALLEQRLADPQVPLSPEEIQMLLAGWLEGPKEEFDKLLIDIGRACRAAIDAGKPCDKTTLMEVGLLLKNF